jgi:2-iminobutanoate/2-iminopropanoate deaminase
MGKQVIQTSDAPPAVGPYSQAIMAQGRYVFVSGQIGLDPATGSMVVGDISEQAEQALRNVRAVLSASGASLSDVVKVTVLLQDVGDFAALNSVYARFFVDEPPARATFGGLQLPLGALVEIECIAVLT